MLLHRPLHHLDFPPFPVLSAQIVVDLIDDIGLTRSPGRDPMRGGRVQYLRRIQAQRSRDLNRTQASMHLSGTTQRCVLRLRCSTWHRSLKAPGVIIRNYFMNGSGLRAQRLQRREISGGAYHRAYLLALLLLRSSRE